MIYTVKSNSWIPAYAGMTIRNMEKILKIGRRIIPKKVFEALQPLYHFSLAFLANIIYRFPGRKIRVIGITGTNGKSTTANLIVKILEEAGYKVGLTSTTNFQVGDEKWENLIDKTTAGRFQSIKLLRQMVKAKCDYAVLEVSSHGIAQFRIWGIPFDVAILTNMSHDHLDFHKTFENYVATKERLFTNVAKSKRKRLRFPSLTGKKIQLLSKSFAGLKKERVKKFIILNQDDPLFGRFNKRRADLNISYSTKNKRASLLAKNVEITEKGSSFNLVSYKGPEIIDLKIRGLFNVYNALASISLGLTQDIDLKTIKRAVEKFEGISGRLEVIEKNGKTVVIDYAHTPDALENVYKTVREFAKGNLIAVFGATGDRDRTKRPVMGEIAGRMADIVYLTDEEPGNEDPFRVIEEVVPGVLNSGKREGQNFFKITDRKEAIQKAIRDAKKGDVVIITGIGHQKFRLIKGVQEPWDERGIVALALNSK